MNIVRFCMVDESYSFLRCIGSTAKVTGGTAAEACILPQLVLHNAGPNLCVCYIMQLATSSRNAEIKDWNIEKMQT